MQTIFSRQVQIRRGSETEHNEFTGAIGEITMDTTNKTLRVHDGETPGGTPLARQATIDAADYVTETWRSTDGTQWYRKYKSGWVEQGGVTTTEIISLNVAMMDTNYNVTLTGECKSTNNNIYLFSCRNLTTTSFTTQGNVLNNRCESAQANTNKKYWCVCGFYAQN